MCAYRYTDDNDKPLARCPECGHDLTAENGVRMCLTDGHNHTWNENTNLDRNGDLVDVGGQVGRGMHSATYCGECGEMLINMGGVWEDDMVGEDKETATLPVVRKVIDRLADGCHESSERRSVGEFLREATEGETDLDLLLAIVDELTEAVAEAKAGFLKAMGRPDAS